MSPVDHSINAPTSEIPRATLKLLSAGFSFFVAGTNDGSIGALIPYMIKSYNIGTSLIAVLYFTTFLGWLVAAATNSHAPKFFNIGALLTIGAALQLLSQALRAWHPPFGLFAVTFFITGLGQAYQDSHANTFVSTVKGAHRWLGFIHAMYGLGLLVAPFVATAVASKSSSSRWALFYLFPLGLSMINLVSVVFSFSDSLNMIRRDLQTENATVEEEDRNKSALKEVKQLLGIRDIWIISLFFFFYLGVGTTSGGWVVEYLVRVRHGNLANIGYVPSGSYGGVLLGRLLLAEPTHRFGERLMLSAYAFICLVLQLVFWLVPNLISSIVVFSLMGFFLGPFFAAGVSVGSRIFPKQVQPAALGLVFVVGQAGAAIFPSLIGLIASRAGVQVLPPIVVALIVAMGLTWAFVPKPLSHQE
ncbi:putative MFS transporter [Hyaloscypha variabilis F]|uniref:Putative MFS transporter n=1 Tax=Hyaloscypha variabilis (strain UAMH 11265 / GT02V1 / F) TaxID=1149755 RepID=A0A2J6RZ86_HYAVF|nr:putative MFS transporter [Hyaloscypha variabilis F]